MKDLKNNIWHNVGETGLDANGYRKESNGINDDGNGFVDDVIGWHFAFDTPDPTAHVFGVDRLAYRFLLAFRQYYGNHRRRRKQQYRGGRYQLAITIANR